MSSEIKVLDPEKLKARRGKTTLATISERTKGVYAISSLHAIENGKFLPAPKKLPTLLKAYRVQFDDVSKPLRA